MNRDFSAVQGGPVLLTLVGGHVDHEVYHPVAMARFVVIPGVSLIKWSLGAMPAPAPKMEAWVLQLKSQETVWFSE